MRDRDPSEELEEQTADAIKHAIALGISEEEARLLCYQTGVQYRLVAPDADTRTARMGR